MRKISLIMLCLLSFVLVKAQAPCAVFYTELGERFTVYIDGVAQHQYSEPNVKVLDISGLSHNVRITFENGFIEDVNKSINLANGTESTFMIHKKQGRYDLSPKNQIPLNQASRAASTNAQQVVSFRGNNVVTTTTTTNSSNGNGGNTNGNVDINMGVSGDGGNVNMNISVSDNSNNTNGTVSTNVGVSNNGGNKDASASGNVKGGNAGGGKKGGLGNSNNNSNNNSNGGNVNMNVSVSGNSNSSSNGTVTSSVGVSSNGGGNNASASGHVVNTGNSKSDVGVSTNGGVKSSNSSGNAGNTKPRVTPNVTGANNLEVKTVVNGYNGRIGCPNPMSADAFAKAKESVQSKNFSNAQLTVAKQIADANCLLVSQVKELMKIFDFEESRFEFAKYAYKHTCDIDNFYQVNDAFDFEGSITKLDEYIKSVK
jgi:hypothetical protein